ncbi:hypothetical protein SESBI_32444 [Sesbania bispinosa]|nr:hypothetical protein SESBI_32444 [Sesbania bispinosa]
MSRTGLLVTKKFRSVLDVLHASRFQSNYGNGTLPRNCSIMSAAKLRNGYWMNLGLQLVSNAKVQPPVPTSPSFKFPYWLRWVLSSIFTLLLPFWKYDLKKLQRIEEEAEFVVEEVEKVANVVEKVAIVAEKISEEVAEKLPEDGKLKKVALVVERVSKHVAHDAQLTVEFIHKVEEFKNVESFIEPIIDKIVKIESERK